MGTKPTAFRVALAISAAFAIGTSSTAESVQPLELTPVGGSLWRWMYDVKVSSNYAYCGLQFGLLVLDVSQPALPTLVSRLHTPNGPLKGIAIDGDYAFLAAGNLLIVDISNPASPQVVADVEFDPLSATEVCVVAGRAYVGSPDPYGHLPPTHDGVVVILDVSDPTNPIWEHSLTTPNNKVFTAAVPGVDVSGNRLLAAKTVTCAGSPMNPCTTQLPPRLEIVDISSPASPSVVGAIGLSGPRAVTAAGDLAFVSDQTAVRIISISNPASPVQVSWLAATPTDIAVSGHHAYVASPQTLTLLNVSRPDSPYVSGSYDSLDAPWGVALADDLAYVADLRLGLHVLDVADSTNPTPLGGWIQAAPTYRMVMSGGYGYAIDQDSGMYVLDLTDPEMPVEVGRFTTRGRPRDIVAQGGFAYIAEDNGGGMQVVNVVDPTNPTLAANYDDVNEARGIDISGSYVYLATYGAKSIQVVDISNPAAPASRGTSPVPDKAMGVRVQGGYAYVAYLGGIRIYRIDSPNSLPALGLLDTLGTATDIDVSGNYAYLANAGNGLRIIDVSNKLSPQVVSEFISLCHQCPFSVDGVQVSGGRAYVTSDRFHVLDVADPVNPVHLVTYLPPDNPSGVAVEEPYIYTTMDYGVVVLKAAQPTGIFDDGGIQPETFTLEANYPNPFNAGTSIRYALGEPSHVKVAVFNVLGRKVYSAYEGIKTAGRHYFQWSGLNQDGQEASSGVYFYRISAGDQALTRKMLLLR